jgi:hypothetical protein
VRRQWEQLACGKDLADRAGAMVVGIESVCFVGLDLMHGGARCLREICRQRVGGVDVQFVRQEQRQRHLHGKRQRRKHYGATTPEVFFLAHQRVNIRLVVCIPALPWR